MSVAKYTVRSILAGLIFFAAMYTASPQVTHIRKIRFPFPSSNIVFNKILQDSKGYLWLGSENGLYRFDGINLKPFYVPSDSVTLHITALHEGPDGSVWIGSNEGELFRMQDGVISRFFSDESVRGTSVSDIATDQNGALWWSYAGQGIYFFHEGEMGHINSDDGLNEDFVYDLECDRNGMVWAGTDAGIASCSWNEGRLSVVPLHDDIILPDMIVMVIKEDNAGRLWLGFQDGGTGFILPDRSGFHHSYTDSAWPYGPVREMVILDEGAWISTAKGDLLQVTPDKTDGPLKSMLQNNLEKPGKINDLIEDKEGNVWIASHSGLYRSSGTRLQFLIQNRGKSLDNIHAVACDLNYPDNLWYSNDDGLFRFDLGKGISRQFLKAFNKPDLKITCLFQDQHGFIWAGTFNYGIFRINPSDGSWIQIREEQGLVNDNVLSVSGHNDTLWLATLGGASEIILKGNEFNAPFDINAHNRDNGLVNNFIYSVFEDKHDQIWFATDGDGISVLTKKGWVSYNKSNGLDDEVIYSISGDKYDNIWIATASKGLYKYDGEQFIHFGLEDGLSSLEITGIKTIDEEVVIIHNKGINILHIPTGQFVHYGEEVGIGDIFPDLNVISKDLQGNIWMGTQTGIIRYRPGAYAREYTPRTIIEEMSIYLEPTPMAKGLVLGNRENHVSFTHTGLWFSNPEKVSYQVYLEGYDLGWKNTYDRTTTYSSLSPGAYTFHVRSSNGQSFRNASAVSYSFRIKDPFYFSAWFIVMTTIMLVAFIFMIVRIREVRMRRFEQQKKEKVEFEFQVLKNQVNPHFLFNSFSTLMSLIEEQPGQAIQYTEKLSDFYRTILQLKDQEVIPLDEEIKLVESYFFILKKRFSENLNMDIKLEKKSMATFIPPMTLQILIENAVKHNIISREYPLYIRIYEDGDRIVVENNFQPKKIAEVSTGIGLENIRKRYRLITKVEPVIEKTVDLFRVKLPVIKG